METAAYTPPPAGAASLIDPFDAGPILFLNPAVILPTLSAAAIGGQAVRGIRTVPPLPNGSVDRINAIFPATGAVLVITNAIDLGDVRRRLASVGLRCAYHPDWITDQTLPGTARGIAAWLVEHGTPPHAVIDRPGLATTALASVAVAAGQEVPAAGCAALIAALS